MNTSITKNDRNLGALIHLSTFTKFFIPFGNFILPLVLWSANKDKNAYASYHGKEVLNFQLSMLLFSVLASVISIPFFIGFFPDALFDNWGFNKLHRLNNFNVSIDHAFSLRKILLPLGISGLLYSCLSIINLVYTILGTLKANEGVYFKYPLSIKFLK